MIITRPFGRDARSDSQKYQAKTSAEAKALTIQFNTDYSLLPDLFKEDYQGDSLAFTQANWINFYIRMHKITGNMQWLHNCRTVIDFMFDNTDQAKQARAPLVGMPYFQAPQSYLWDNPGTAAPGWAKNESGQRRIEAITDGNICRHILRFVDYVESIGIRGYDTESYLDKCEVIIDSHDSEFVFDRYAHAPGSYYYTSTVTSGLLFSHPVPFNHTLIMGSCHYMINKYRPSAERANKFRAIFEFFRMNLREVSDYYEWDYGVKSDTTSLTGELEDVNHASYDAQFVAQMYEEGTCGSMVAKRLVNTVKQFITETSCAHYVDGTGSDDGGDWVVMYDGFVDLAKLTGDNETVNLVEESLAYYVDNNAVNWSAVHAAKAKVIESGKLK